MSAQASAKLRAMALPFDALRIARHLLLALFLIPAAALAAPGAATHSFDYQGIDLTLTIAPLDATGALRVDEPIAVRLAVRDGVSTMPLSALTPAAWLHRVAPGEEPDPAACQRRAESFLGGSLLSAPTVDLNIFSVLTLDEDSTLSVLDPRFGFGASRLIAQLPLPAPAADWTLTAAQDRLFVSLPTAGQVAVIDTGRWRVSKLLDVGASPRRLLLQPDGRYLWVGCDDDRPGQASGVTILDAVDLEVVGHVATGAGAHDLASSEDGRHVFVTNRESGTTSLLDTAALKKIHDLETEAPLSVAWSTAAQAAYVVNGADGTVVALDSRAAGVRARIEVGPGLGDLRFAPGGRFGLVVDARRNRVHIIDTARDRVVQSAKVEASPDRVTFSDALAYVRHRDSEIVLMIPLDSIGQADAPVPVLDFPGGQHPFSRDESSVAADGIVQVPGASAVLVANPRDHAVYYYKEGMAAPMGGFPTGDRRPRAVLALDRSLQERAPGTYGTTLWVEEPGAYQLVLYLDNPRLVRCFGLEVEASPGSASREPEGPSIAVEVLEELPTLAPGQSIDLRFRLTDAESRQPLSSLKDVSILTFRAPGRGRRRLPATALGDGIYGVRLTLNEPGLHYVFLACPSRGLHVGNQPQLVLTVSADRAATER